jgi:hypothetical protein
MKKYLLILATIIGLGVSANAASILLRGTQKVCGNGAELTLYQTGKMVFWYDGEKKSGKYNIEDGYINLFDENGENIFSFKYSYDNRTHTLLWVDVKGQRLTKGGCE